MDQEPFARESKYVEVEENPNGDLDFYYKGQLIAWIEMDGGFYRAASCYLFRVGLKKPNEGTD
jgi:hypothetical protein